MLFESTDEDVVHRNVCRIVKTIPAFYSFTVLKEKSSLSKSDWKWNWYQVTRYVNYHNLVHYLINLKTWPSIS